MLALVVVTGVAAAPSSGLAQKPVAPAEPVVVPPGIEVDLAVGPLGDDDVYLPKYPGELPCKVSLVVKDQDRGISFHEPSVHLDADDTVDRFEQLQDEHVLSWRVTLSADASSADVSLELVKPADPVAKLLLQSIEVHLGPHRE